MADFDRTSVITIEYDLDEAIQNVNKLTDEIVDLESEQAALKKAFKDGTITAEQYSQGLAENREIIKKGKSDRSNYIKQLQSEKGSVEALQAEIKRMTKERDRLNQNTKEGRARAQELNKSLDEMKGALKEARTGTKQTGNAVTRLFKDLSELPGPIGGIVRGLGGMTKAALKFVATPLGAILTIIVGLVKAMTGAFKRSEARMNTVRSATSRLGGFFKGFQKILEPLVDFIIAGFVKSLELLEKALLNTLSGVSKALRFLGFKKAAANLAEYKEELIETANANQALVDLEAELTRERRNQRRIQLEFQKLAEKQRQIRDDEARGIQERIDANEELGRVLQKQLKEELRIANLALEVANKRIEVEGETTKALDERGQALTEIADIEERIVGQQSEQLVNINSLLREREDLEKQAQDRNRENAIDRLENLQKESKLQQENNELLQEIEANHKQRLLEIDQAYTEQILYNEQRRLDAVLQSVDEITESYGALADERIRLQSELLNATTKFAALEEKTEKEKFAVFGSFANQLNALSVRNFENELAALEFNRQRQLEIVGDNIQAQDQINREFAQKKAELDRKQFNDEKRKAITDTLINTAVAVVKALPNIPLSIIVGTTGAAQTAVIATKQYQPSSYDKGGKMTLFKGPSHRGGGVDLFGTDGSHLKVEGNESAYVLKKDATAHIAALSSINESFGGKSFNVKSRYMQEGGQADLGNQLDPQTLAEAFSNITIVTTVDDIRIGSNRFDDVVSNSIV